MKFEILDKQKRKQNSKNVTGHFQGIIFIIDATLFYIYANKDN